MLRDDPKERRWQREEKARLAMEAARRRREFASVLNEKLADGRMSLERYEAAKKALQENGELHDEDLESDDEGGF
jgi:hypothetical protein